jgi:crotonobetainyl-CoA:carnitine CoA-transferase CaiB-like acyl-CoA transferase
MFNSRVQSENEAAASMPTQNRVPAPKLSQLLDERKAIRSRRDMEFLAKRFDVDVEKLDAVAKFVNTPSVQQNSVVRAADKDGEEKQIMKVRSAKKRKSS